VTTVLIIGASRGIGLETVKAALEVGHSVRDACAVSPNTAPKVLTRLGKHADGHAAG
jgi:NAD(P)-dependent dehydrogenase (short-subunit alcohol dehydrogenase family)